MSLSLWWVNERSFDEARKTGVIFAGLKEVPYQSDLMRMKVGDLTFHFAGSALRAIGRIAAPPVEKEQRPYDEPELGRVVKVAHQPLAKPIPIKELPKYWRDEAGGPFDRNGNVRSGVVFPMPPFLAERLVAEFGVKVPSTGNLWPVDPQAVRAALTR